MKKIPITNGGKVCGGCNTWKKLSEFPYRGKCKDCRNAWFADYRAKRKKQVFDHYGNKCVCCGETEPVFLSLDHVDGGGNQERTKKRTSPYTYELALKEGLPERFQILCFNCNWAKHAVGICPHQR